MAKNVNVKGFRKMNGLTQEALGEFLGCSKGFISQVESGMYPLPDDKLEALLDNNRGWDTSLLMAPDVPSIMAEGMSAVNNSSVQVSADPALIAIIQRQQTQFDVQQAQMGELIQMMKADREKLENLTKK